jgi:hypothetical protein
MKCIRADCFCVHIADSYESSLDYNSLGRPTERMKTSPRPAARLSGHHTQVCVVVAVDTESHFVSADESCLVRGGVCGWESGRE